MEQPELFDDDRRSREEPPESSLLLERLHRALTRWNLRRLRPEQPTRRWRDEIEEDLRIRSLEGEWIEAERSALGEWTRDLPRSSGGFLRWFEALRLRGPAMPEGLAGRATLEQVRWWIRQELTAMSGLEALVGLLRLRMPDLRGMLPGVQVTGVARLVRFGRALGLESDGIPAVWESLAVFNLEVGFAFNRRYAWHALGALGVVALTAPDRIHHVSRAVRSLGVGSEETDLAGEHARALGWIRELFVPRVEESPDRVPWLAEGALLQLRADARCVRRYRSELGVPGQEPATD
jgi:hypothetical protein